MCSQTVAASHWMQLVSTYGVVMMTSASTSSLSNVESSPSLSEVVTSVWPWSSSHLRMPSSFSVVPSSSGTYSICNPAISMCVLSNSRPIAIHRRNGGVGRGCFPIIFDDLTCNR
jgi:hypothetical protein